MKIQTLKNISGYKKYNKGSVIKAESDRKSDEMYIIYSGSVEITKFKEDNIETVVRKKGQYFGVLDFFCGIPYKEKVVALEDSIIINVANDKFADFASRNTETIYELITALCEKILGIEPKDDELITESEIEANEQDMEEVLEEVTPQEAFDTTSITAEEELVENVENSPKQDKVRVEDAGLTQLFPDGHKHYDIPRSEIADAMLYDKDCVCPLCKHKFKSKKPLSTKLRQKGMLDCELKREYYDISAYWYEVITCPNCWFSTFESFWENYMRVSSETKDILKSAKEALKIDFEEPRDINAAFTAYYLAILCSHSFVAYFQISFKAKRQLAWLYEESGDEEMQKIATQDAFVAAREYFDNTELSGDNLQATYMILGTLAHKLEDYDVALRYLSEAKFITDGKIAYKRLITDRIAIVKEDRDEAKKLLEKK